VKYHRRSIRLNGFDYSNDGYYFVTICVQNRQKIFGEINNNRMDLNENGLICKIWLLNLINRFNIEIDDYQIMPDHLHMIIKIVGANHDSPKNDEKINIKNNIDYINYLKNGTNTNVLNRTIHESPLHRSLLSNIIGYLKMNTSKEIGKKLWQRNYYERIIRNEKEYLMVKKYIEDNPINFLQPKTPPKGGV